MSPSQRLAALAQSIEAARVTLVAEIARADEISNDRTDPNPHSRALGYLEGAAKNHEASIRHALNTYAGRTP